MEQICVCLTLIIGSGKHLCSWAHPGYFSSVRNYSLVWPFSVSSTNSPSQLLLSDRFWQWVCWCQVYMILFPFFSKHSWQVRQIQFICACICLFVDAIYTWLHSSLLTSLHPAVWSTMYVCLCQIYLGLCLYRICLYVYVKYKVC